MYLFCLFNVLCQHDGSIIVFMVVSRMYLRKSLARSQVPIIDDVLARPIKDRAIYIDRYFCLIDQERICEPTAGFGFPGFVASLLPLVFG